MFSGWTSGLTRTFGARLAAWYFALFAAGALLVVLLAGLLLSLSLARRDRDGLRAALLRYTDAYADGGAAVLGDVIAADRAAASYEPILVRVIGGGRTRMLSLPIEWGRFELDRVPTPRTGETSLQRLEADGRTLEVLSARLPDGTLFQVGRSTAGRDAVLGRFQETALVLLALIAIAGLGGGVLLTNRALQPLEGLRATVTRILETGRTSERVPVGGTPDPLDALGALVNRMLERIDGLVKAMQGTLDNVAHDLRTPVTRLRGTAEVALQGERTPQELREALADCVEEADRVSHLLDALMDLAEAESGRLPLRSDTVMTTEVVQAAVELYGEVADDRAVTITFEAEPVPPVTGDRIRLRQVFANLIDNAVKYTPPGGRIGVSVRHAGAGVEVVVEDSGSGIRDADLPRIWERLYRADESRSKRGLGIGLSLVRAIVEAHGGRATAESEVGRGSRFRIWLPAAAGEMTQT